MKKILAMTIFLAVGSLCCPGQDKYKLKGARQQKVRPLLFSLISANQIDRTLRTLISSLLIGLSCLMARLNGT